MKRDPHETSALIAGIAAFVTWGLVPVYWKLLRFIPATEILAHRFVWTCFFMILLLSWQRRWPEVLANARSPRTALFCAGSGIAIAINWFVFIWAVNAGHVLETSLGYFMSPLVNVLLGAIFLRERLTRAQLVSVLLASGAVCYLTFGFGRLPWVALTSLLFRLGFTDCSAKFQARRRFRACSWRRRFSHHLHSVFCFISQRPVDCTLLSPRPVWIFSWLAPGLSPACRCSGSPTRRAIFA